ncbi:tRNA (adenosine(37)-N6)-threonylcarbamoyltransferase complex dimerization subunit type 1 TsaB [Defluviimonas sp. SAOS-178_SWC]|uniref:tRNA (adenosine(37)-N6)-threonylcarbamoyltransferase complex dimerization subunit type 1 TsaB n=1 Tax=Defluviimonas sp. SAOS-178_SWC TaxID=3121287 RepID=UPI003221EF4D
MADPLILAFDTSAAHCAAALLSGDIVLAARSEEMGRGQAERLMPLLEELLFETGKSWTDLDALGVGTGPGNFTGIRISVAAARGLALALDIPAVGVNGFDARACGEATSPVLIAIEAPRAMVYLQRRDGNAAEPELRPAADIGALDAPVLWLSDLPGAEMAARIAHVARDRRGEKQPRPAPLYLRPADAAPMRDAPPVILP